MGLTKLAIRRPLTVLMVILMIVIMGARSYTMLQVDRIPKVDFPFVTVITVFPGASPQDVEDLIIKPIEDAVAGVSGIDTISSQANEGVAVVALSFKEGVDGDKAATDVERKIASMKSALPAESLDPSIIKTDVNATPIMQVVLSGPQGQDALAKYAGDNIKARLQAIPGVASVSVSGGRERQVFVDIDPERLTAYGVSLSSVQSALAANNMTFPVGVMESGRQRTSLRSIGTFATLDDINRLVVGGSSSMMPAGMSGVSSGGQESRGAVHLSDVATVHSGYEDQTRILRYNGTDTVGISIVKSGDANTVEVADSLHKTIQEINRDLPAGAKLMVVVDDSNYTRASVNGVRNDLILAILITGLVMLVFLHTLRSTFIVLLAIPTSIIATFLVMWALGFSLNIMTLLALTLVIGILVDDSIVVIENIERHLKMGKRGDVAAVDGRAEIGLAAITITLVDVVVYLPVAFTSGIVGQFFRSYGITIVASTLFSLLVSFTLTPMLAARWLKANEGKVRQPKGIGRVLSTIFRPVSRLWNGFVRVWESGFTALADGYANLIRWALSTTRSQILVLLIAAVALGGGIYMVAGGLVGAEFMPQEDDGQFIVTIEMAPGTNLSATNVVARRVEDVIRSEVPETAMILTEVGSDGSSTNGSTSTPNAANITTKLVDKSKRTRSTSQIVEPLRHSLARIPDANISIELSTVISMGGGSTINVEVTGDDPDTLIDVANQVAAAVRSVPGTVDILNTDAARATETQIIVDRQLTSNLGLTSAGVAGTLRTALSGTQVGKFQQEGEGGIPIMLRVAPEARTDLEQIRALPVSFSNGKAITLGQVTQIGDSQAAARIMRTNRQHTLTIRSNVTGRPSGDVTNDIDAAIKAQVKFPAGYSYAFSGVSSEQMESFAQMGLALALSIILIYMLLVALYQNWLHPLAIMFSLPVTLVGAFGGLWLTGRTLNLISLLGVVLLTGVVTKNAILIVDFTNGLRASQNMSCKAALAEAGRLRLRPILMTTAAIVFALLPLLFATSAGAELRAPMAAVVIGGNITSTLLSLVLVPVVYNILDGLGGRLSAFVRRLLGIEQSPAGDDSSAAHSAVRP